MSNYVDLSDNVYGDDASEAEAAVRRATYREDIGQSSWMTAAERLGFAERLGVHPASHQTALVGREGEANFMALQRFLACVEPLLPERRLSRIAYLAEKSACPA